MYFICPVIQFFVLATIALHLMAGLFPEKIAWSVWPYTALPGPLAWLAGLAVASLVLVPVNDAVGQWVQRLARALRIRKRINSVTGVQASACHRAENSLKAALLREVIFLRILSKRAHILPVADNKRLWFAAIALGMAIPFWIFRIRHLRWGDAYFIVNALSYTGSDRPVWTVYNWQAPLSIFFHARLWFLLNPVPGVSVQTLYAVTSVLSGIGFVYVLFLLADALGYDWAEKATIFGLVITTGSMQLFFGYVENYTIISSGLILTLYLGVRSLQGKVSLVWPSLVLAVTNAFHPSTIVLWPAMGYLGWRVASRRLSAQDKALTWARLALPPILVFAGLVMLMMAGGHGPGALLYDDRPGGADGILFVPLFRVTTEWQHYTMFSLAHGLDWANEHFLISPFGLPLLLLVAISAIFSRRRPFGLFRDNNRPPTSPQSAQDAPGISVFLTIASLAYLLLTFVWNPDYGGRRDWDLFAPSAFVYTLLAAYLLARQLGDRRIPRVGRCSLARVARLLIATSALYAIAWIHYNTIPWPYH